MKSSTEYDERTASIGGSMYADCLSGMRAVISFVGMCCKPT